MLKPTHPNAPPRSSLHPQDLQSADGSIFRVNGKGLARIFVRKSAETARNRVSGNTLLLASTKKYYIGVGRMGNVSFKAPDHNPLFYTTPKDLFNE